MQVTRRLPGRLWACAAARSNVDEPARLTAPTTAARAARMIGVEMGYRVITLVPVMAAIIRSAARPRNYGLRR